MRYELKAIEERVYSLLDENPVILTELTAYEDPGTSLRGLIESLLPDAALIVLSTAARGEIDECRHMFAADDSRESEAGAGIYTHIGDERGAMTLPKDFLRMLYFKMSDWRGGVVAPLAFGGEEHQLRMGNGRVGHRRRQLPAVSVEERGDRKRLLVYGTSRGSYVEACDWIAVPCFESGGIDLPQRQFGAVCAKLAEMIRLVTG